MVHCIVIATATLEYLIFGHVRAALAICHEPKSHMYLKYSRFQLHSSLIWYGWGLQGPANNCSGGYSNRDAAMYTRHKFPWMAFPLWNEDDHGLSCRTQGATLCSPLQDTNNCKPSYAIIRRKKHNYCWKAASAGLHTYPCVHQNSFKWCLYVLALC